MTSPKFDTPIERLRYILYKFTSEISFIDEVDEDVIIKRAMRLLAYLVNRGPNQRVHGIHTFEDDLKKALDDYADDVILNRSV